MILFVCVECVVMAVLGLVVATPVFCVLTLGRALSTCMRHMKLESHRLMCGVTECWLVVDL